MHCWKCGSEAFVKNGFMAGSQRYKCKKCGFQFTRDTPHGKPMKDKILALVLYLSGLSMNVIGKILGVTAQSVMRWIKMFEGMNKIMAWHVFCTRQNHEHNTKLPKMSVSGRG